MNNKPKNIMIMKPLRFLLWESNENLSFQDLSDKLLYQYKTKTTAQNLSNIAKGRNDATPELEEVIRQCINNDTYEARNEWDDINDLCELAETILREYEKTSATKHILKTVIYKAIDLAEKIISNSNNDTYEARNEWDSNNENEVNHLIYPKVSQKVEILLTGVSNETDVFQALGEVVVTNTISKKKAVSFLYENSIFFKSDKIRSLIECAASKIIISNLEASKIPLHNRIVLDNLYHDANKSKICDAIYSSYKTPHINIHLTISILQMIGLGVSEITLAWHLWNQVDRMDFMEYKQRTEGTRVNYKILFDNLDAIQKAIGVHR
jgi:hypothetical protein